MTRSPQYLLGVVDTRVMTLLDLGGPFIDEVNPSSPYLGTRVPIGTFLTIWIPRIRILINCPYFTQNPVPIGPFSNLRATIDKCFFHYDWLLAIVTAKKDLGPRCIGLDRSQSLVYFVPQDSHRQAGFCAKSRPFLDHFTTLELFIVLLIQTVKKVKL